MIMNRSYLNDLIEQIKLLPDSYFSDSELSKEQILSHKDIMESLWAIYQKNVEEYSCDPEWSCKDALNECLKISDNPLKAPKTVCSKEDLKKWTLSEYNEGTNAQLDYYINRFHCKENDTAYLYSHEDNTLTKMEIVKIIRRSDDLKYYDSILENENVLIDGESEYGADTSAEFIMDDDCFLVWFRYKEKLKEIEVTLEKTMRVAKSFYVSDEQLAEIVEDFPASEFFADMETELGCGNIEYDYAVADSEGRTLVDWS